MSSPLSVIIITKTKFANALFMAVQMVIGSMNQLLALLHELLRRDALCVRGASLCIRQRAVILTGTRTHCDR